MPSRVSRPEGSPHGYCAGVDIADLGLGHAPASPPSPARVALRWGGAVAIALTLAWLSATRGGWVPFLSGVDLGIHEFGHMIAFWAPFLVVALAGSALQVAVPAGLAAYFWWRRDRFAVVLMLAWLGVSLNNVAVYVRDATRMELALWGDDGSGAGHDWRTILGELGWLGHTDAIAGLVTLMSVLAFGSAIALALRFAWDDLRPRTSADLQPR